MVDVACTVDFGNSINGAWISLGKGEIAVYSDKFNTAIVIGNYDNLKDKNQSFMNQALIFNKNGEVLLQTSEDGKKYNFEELHPQLVALKIRDFLSSLQDCKKQNG